MSKSTTPSQRVERSNISFGGNRSKQLKHKASALSLMPDDSDHSGYESQSRDFADGAENGNHYDSSLNSPSKGSTVENSTHSTDDSSKQSGDLNLAIDRAQNLERRSTETGRRADAGSGGQPRAALDPVNASRTNSGEVRVEERPAFTVYEDRENRPDDSPQLNFSSAQTPSPSFLASMKQRSKLEQAPKQSSADRIPSQAARTSDEESPWNDNTTQKPSRSKPYGAEISAARKSPQLSIEYAPNFNDTPGRSRTRSSVSETPRAKPSTSKAINDTAGPNIRSRIFQPRSADPRASLKRLLELDGKTPVLREVHRYTVRYANMDKQEPGRHLQKLVHDVIVDSMLDPTVSVAVNKTTYLSIERVTVQDPSNGRHMDVSAVALLADLVDTDQTAAQDPKLSRDHGADFIKIFDGYRADGKVNRRWVKFENLSTIPLVFTDTSTLSDGDKIKKAIADIEKAMEQQGSADDALTAAMPGQKFAIWLEHETISLTDIASLVSKSANATQSQILDTTIAAVLRGALMGEGESAENIASYGKKTFSAESSVLPSGLMEKKGLEGRLVISDTDNAPRVYYQPITGRFFNQDQTVATFLTSVFGADRLSQPTQALLEKMKNMLRGTTVIIGVKDGFRKQTGVIHNIGSNAFCSPESLNGLKASITLGDLKFPRIPCVNVGDSKKPFYFPAELCKFAPNQMFRGEPLLVDRTDLFIPKTIKSGPVHTPSGGPGPFAGTDVAGFRLTFVNLRHAEQTFGAKPSVDLRPEVWKVFQREIGRRFDGVLQSAVTKAKEVEIQHQTIDETLAQLARMTVDSTGSRIALVVAVPDSLPIIVASAIKAQCDTLTGVQCCLVSAHELARRYHPATPDKMVKYTGQIVRKILGRANIAGKPHGYEKAKSLDEIEKALTNHGHGRLYGIHVAKVQDFRQTDFQQYPGLAGKLHYLISIVSVPSQTPDSEVRTTHHIASVEKDGAAFGRTTLESNIVQYLAEHTGTGATGIARASIVMSAFGTISRDYFNSLANSIGNASSAIIDLRQMKAKNGSVQFVLFAPQSQVVVDSASPVVIQTVIPGDQQKDPGAEIGLFLPSVTLDRIYRRPDGFRHHDGTLRRPAAVWHVMRKQLGPGVPHETLERRHLPDVLHLARAASKRARSYVYLKDSGEGPAKKWTYAVTPIHDDLRNSLFFV